ncbi:hypothetical protein ACJMK2_021988 [Sinanodonta woodiana]|uniref:Uncharacterized protein n=1 Tax=Sinanodonta woodiana TaxID=1069815 RepID=A0ABD3THQ0_SINWO
MTEKKILQISAGAVIQHVQVVLKDGVHLCCNLNDYCPGETSGFIEKYRTSRTRFLKWLGFEEEYSDSDIITLGDFNTPDKETTYMKQSISEIEKNSSTLITFDSENTNGEAKVQLEREECQGITCLDRTMIKAHLIAIADSFQGSFDHFTTLLGLVDPWCIINNLAEPGAVKVQVLGGNHTRAALQLLRGKTEYRKDKSYDHVIMDVYKGLSEEQCLYVKDEFSREGGILPLTVREEKRSMNNKSPNVIAVSWRAEISTFAIKTVSIVF